MQMEGIANLAYVGWLNVRNAARFQDVAQAMDWYTKSVAAGDTDAPKKLADLQQQQQGKGTSDRSSTGPATRR